MPTTPMPPRPGSPSREWPAPGRDPAGGRRARDAAPTLPPRRHDPRALAALCYSVPLVPACVLLLRERKSRFVRFHAAQSLVFFGLVVAAQAVLYLLLVVAGGLIATDALALATGVAVVIVGLFAALGILVLMLWLRLLADCVRGRSRRLPVAGAWAERVERLFARLTDRVTERRPYARW